MHLSQQQPQQPIRHLASSTRSRQNTSAESISGRTSKPPNRGGGPGPTPWAKPTLSGHLIHLMEAEQQRQQTAAILFPPKPPRTLLISIRLCLSTGGETAGGSCKLSSTAATFHFSLQFPAHSGPEGCAQSGNLRARRGAEPRKHQRERFFLIPKTA